jgi:hypothetical protein
LPVRARTDRRNAVRLRGRQGSDGDGGGALETLLVAGLLVVFAIAIVGLLYVVLSD